MRHSFRSLTAAAACLAYASFFASTMFVTAQPAWRPIGQILSAPAPIEIAPTTGDGLVVSTGSNVRALVDGRWVDATGLDGLGTEYASRLVRSTTGTLFISMGGRGTFQSTDGGSSWARRETEVAAASSAALYRQIPLTDTLQRSTDDGRSWTTVTQPFMVTNGFISIAADHRVREIIAYRHDSIAISSDDGDSWSTLLPIVGNQRFWKVRVAPTSMFIVASSGVAGGDVWRSTTSGRTWQPMSTDHEHPTYSIIEGLDGTIVHVDQAGSASISFDRGGTWRPTAPGLCDQHHQRVTAFALDSELRIIAGTSSAGLYRYVFGSWHEQGFVEPSIPLSIRQYGDVLRARVDTVGWESRDGGASWTCAEGAPEAIDAEGVWYRSRWQIERSTDRGRRWTIIGEDFRGLPYYASYLPVVSARGTVLGVYSYNAAGTSSGVLRLPDDDRWVTFERHDGIVSGELLASPDSTLYYSGGSRLDRSTDDGLTWDAIDSARRTSLIAADDGTLYAFGDGQRAFRSSDRGSTWTLLDWGKRTPYSLKPHGARGLFAVYTDSTGVLFVGYSDDQGATMAEIMTGLDGARPMRIYDTGSDAVILGTDRGMFRFDAVGGSPDDLLPDALDLTLHGEN